LLMKMPHVQIVISVARQPQYLLPQRQRHPLRSRLPTPPIKQSVIAELFVTFAPAPHVPVADSDDLRCLPPRDLPRHSPQNHFLYFHRPLHRGLRVREHACHGLLPSPPEKRTSHVLSQPDISCANDTPRADRLTNTSCQCTCHTLSSVSKTNCVREGKDMAGNDALAHPFFLFRSRFSKCSPRLLTLTLTLLGCALGSSRAHAQATTAVCA